MVHYEQNTYRNDEMLRSTVRGRFGDLWVSFSSSSFSVFSDHPFCSMRTKSADQSYLKISYESSTNV
jgi:hypothetical protein